MTQVRSGRLTSCLILIPAAMLSATASAQDAPPPGAEPPSIVADLFACRTIEEAAARLACFDREVGTIQEKQQRKEIVIAGKEEVRETRKGLFGFTLPKIGLFSGDDEEDEVTRVETTIASARRMRNGRVSFTTQDGASWIQTDKTPVLRDPNAGDTVAIKKGAVGSYMAKIGKARAFRAKRVD